MSKLSIDMHTDAGDLVDVEMFQRANSGCRTTLKMLGALGEFVTVFRVTFSRIAASGPPGPSFTVYFKDPLGRESVLNTDYRYMGSSGNNNPTASEIVDGLVKRLPYAICEHCKQSVPELVAAMQKVASLPVEH